MSKTEAHEILYRCGNETIGCGKPVPWSAYNNSVNACHECSARAARKWRIKIADVPSLSVAILNARAGKMGEEPTDDEVWNLLTMLRVEKQFWIPPPSMNPPSESQIPAGDRQEAPNLFPGE